MTDSHFDRVALAQAAMGCVPPLIRRTLLDKSVFREEFGLETVAVITSERSRVSVQHTMLLSAIRSVLAGVEHAGIVDESGRMWQLRNEADEGELPILVLIATDDERLMLPDFTVLSNDVTMRIRFLDESAEDLNLPNEAKEKWGEILSVRALEDDEIDLFYRDLRNTPVYLERAIHREIDAGESSISSLVPNSRDYYHRLVGIYDGCTSIRDYALGPGRIFLDHLSEWRPYEGFLYSLLLSSHPSLTAEISVDRLDGDKLVQAYEFVEVHGDMLSRLGAIEVGLRILSDRPEVEPILLRLVQSVRDDDLEIDNSDFNLFSALFVLVDGELSRTHLMSNAPPFYRRLASLAQAALIHRVLFRPGADYKRFSEWALGNCLKYCYMQSLADMRIEPRWIPDLVINVSQIKAYFFGRLMIAGKAFSGNIGEGELRETILGNGKKSLRALFPFPYPCYPGPLEGSEESPNALPEDLARAIEERLGSDEIDASSFIALVNSPMVFRITSSHAELATKALRLGNYTLAKLEDESQLVGILDGLATVAAVSRSSALADELRILVRRYLHDPQYSFLVVEAMRVCLIASAAREDLIEWREFVGSWLTELAFSDMDKNVAEVFYSRLAALLHLVPELWVSCARADAAVKALCSSRVPSSQ